MSDENKSPETPCSPGGACSGVPPVDYPHEPLCAVHPCCELNARKIDRLRAQVARLERERALYHDALIAEVGKLRGALESVAYFAGRTLIAPKTYIAEESRAYSDGANRAFEQCAAIAEAALRPAPEAAASEEPADGR